MKDTRNLKLLPLRAAILATLLAAGAPALADDHAPGDLEVTMDVVDGDGDAHDTNDAHELVVHEERNHDEARHEESRHEPTEEHRDASHDGDHEDSDHEDADDGNVDDNHDDVHDGEHDEGGDHEEPAPPSEDPHTGENHGPG